MNRRVGVLAFIGYIGTIFAANWVVERFGVVPVGFGLMAPAAVYLVGLAFTLRDLVQDHLGRMAVVAAIAVGGALSALVSTRFALASAVAFLVSELADFAIYTPMRERRPWWQAVAASNVVGLVLDSVLFLWLAFGSFEFLPGQIVGKAWMTLPFVAVGLVRHRRREAVA